MPITMGAPCRVRGTGKRRRQLAVTPAQAAGGCALVIAISSGTAFAIGWGPHLTDPAVRSAGETLTTMSALVASVLLLKQFRRHPQVFPLLLLSALAAVALTDFVFSALPPLIRGHSVPLGADASVVSQMLVPVTFAVAAFGGSWLTAVRRRAAVLSIGGCGVGVVVAAEIADLALGRGSSASFGSAATEAIAAVGAALFTLSAAVFLRRGSPANQSAWLIGGALGLLAAARLQELCIQAVAADWVTPRELLRLTAYGLLLAAAYRDYAATCRSDEQAALSAQRERIARDLHDGLAQDLAAIALHADRLGPNHPLRAAARRALAVSREAIVDLAASQAPDTVAALRAVAGELEERYSIEITIRDQVDRATGSPADLDPDRREQFVRVAREAIVNAARHGDARHVDVVLTGARSNWTLTVSDDGSGIPESQLVSPSGFGLRTMRARATEAGGRLHARRREAGGTVLEMSVVGSGPD